MEGQRVVVIHDAWTEINPKVFEWSLNGLSLVPGDMLTLIAVLHQVITPMGYKSSVDSRLWFGANQKIIEAQAARRKEEYMNHPGLTQIFKLYKSEKVGFQIEMATGSSLKDVALKSATNLKATWLILDRKMKNDEEYFLRKLSCGIYRVRRFNKIIRLRGPQRLTQETGPGGSTRETYTDSIPLPDTSTEHDSERFSIESSPNSQGRGNLMDQELGHTPKSLCDERACSTPVQPSLEDKDTWCKQLECETQRGQHSQDKEQIKSIQHGKERDTKLKGNLEEKSERCPLFGGARSFFIGGAKEYEVCEQFFSLSDFHIRN
ncbi:hypothetical protein Fmac_030791 [Flemingia macrophylla]|uniref:Uncharacterized protein n=1 Tax=Flemingia macrophylla TaxID=520843 RepID=A0ABD1L080_9FABA